MNRKRSNSSHERTFSSGHHNSGGKMFKTDGGCDNSGPGLLGAPPGGGLLGAAPAGFQPINDRKREIQGATFPGQSNTNAMDSNYPWAGTSADTRKSGPCTETGSVQGGSQSGMSTQGWGKQNKQQKLSPWISHKNKNVWKSETRNQTLNQAEEGSWNLPKENKSIVWKSEASNSVEQGPWKPPSENKPSIWKSDARNQASTQAEERSRKSHIENKTSNWNSGVGNQARKSSEERSRKSSTENEASCNSAKAKAEKQETVLKCQMKELKDYILKLEDDKKALNAKVDAFKITNNKDRNIEYIMKLEEDKKALNEKIEELKESNKKDGNIIELIKANIEKVKKVQEEEQQRLDQEKHDLVTERNSLKLELAKEKEHLEKERKQIEEEKTSNDKESQGLDPIQCTLFEKRKFQYQLSNMRKEIEDLKKQKDQKEERHKNEEKKHLANELEELEIRREMTRKAIECESVIEQLGEKIESMKQELNELNKKVDNKESENKNLSSEILRLSKQLEESILKEDDLKKRLESLNSLHTQEKEALQKKLAKKSSIIEIDQLKKFHSLEFRCLKAESIEGEKNPNTVNLKAKVANLERDIQFLLETEAGQKEYIEDLKTRNNTLQNQAKSSVASETSRIETQDLRKQLVVITNERDAFKNQLKECKSEKLGWETKCVESTHEIDDLMKILDEQERQKDKAEKLFKEDLSLLKEEGKTTKTKIQVLVEENKKLFSVKSCLELENSDLSVKYRDINKEKDSLNKKQQKLKVDKENVKKQLRDASKIVDGNKENHKKQGKTTNPVLSKPNQMIDQPNLVLCQPNQIIDQPNPVLCKPNQNIDPPNPGFNKPNQNIDKLTQIIIAKPVWKLSQESLDVEQPNQMTNKPITSDKEPNKTTNKPTSSADQPNQITNKPTTLANQPTLMTNKPNKSANQPKSTAAKPTSTAAKPKPNAPKRSSANKWTLTDQDESEIKLSNDMADSCKTHCKLCNEVVKLVALRGHTKSKHKMPITEYKIQFGAEYEIIEKIYHKCGICETIILLDSDSVAVHLKTQEHKLKDPNGTSHKQYNEKYMITKEKPG